MTLEHRQFCLLLESLPEAYVCFQVIDHGEGTSAGYLVVAVNAALERLLGLKKDEIIGKKITEVLPGSKNEDFEWIRRCDNVAATGESTRFEQYCRALERWFEVTAFRVEPGFLAAIYRDITDNKRLYGVLQEVEMLFSDIANNANVLIQSVDHNGKFIFVNRSWKEKLGYRDEEIESLTLWDILHPDSLDHCQAVFKEVLSGKSVNHLEAVFAARDGTTVTVEGNANCRFDGEKVRVMGIFRDITQRKRTEEALIKSEKKYREILATIEEGYYETDLAGNFVFFNNIFCKVSGYARDELMHQSYKMLYRNPEEVFKTFNRVYRTGKPVKTAGWPVITRGGQEIFVEISISLRREDDGSPIGFRGVARDITERKRHEEQLEYLSLHDQLTGLYNRLFFEEEMQRLSGSREYPITVISADLDGLKWVNDTMGHTRGDELLRACAEILRRSLRSSDILARVGGDEFAVLLPRTGKAAGEEVARRIHSNTALHNEKHPDLPLSISVGLATAKAGDTELQEIYIQADAMMYRNKLSNRSGFRSTAGILPAPLPEKE